MVKSWTRHTHLVLITLAFMVTLLGMEPKAHADYMYEFQFAELNLPGLTYPADGFSFTSPALIGPEASEFRFLDSPYINNLTLSTPLELNGFTFSTIRLGGIGYIGDQTTIASLDGIAFRTTLTPDLSRPPGEIVDFWAWISFPMGTYGPGVYNGNTFGRAISDGSLYYSEYTTRSLTISSVAPFPEPATMLLLGSGLLGLIGFRRKLRK